VGLRPVGWMVCFIVVMAWMANRPWLAVPAVFGDVSGFGGGEIAACGDGHGIQWHRASRVIRRCRDGGAARSSRLGTDPAPSRTCR
jgi:hypothetical protein